MGVLLGPINYRQNLTIIVALENNSRFINTLKVIQLIFDQNCLNGRDIFA